MEKDVSDILWESYFYPGTTVLINLFDEHDKEKLKGLEATHTFQKLVELGQEPLDMEIDKNRLNKIHEYLFKDIYPFAGKYRKVNIVKERGTFFFSKEIDIGKEIDAELDKEFLVVDDMVKNCYNLNDFSNILSYLYAKLIFIHPYREGNGRTVREFLREFTIKKGKELGLGELELDWEDLKKRGIDADVEVAHRFPYANGPIFYDSLLSKNNIKTK